MQDIIKILVQDYYLTIKMYGLYFTPGLLMMRILGDFYFGKKVKDKNIINLIYNYFIMCGFIAVVFQIACKIVVSYSSTLYSFARATVFVQS
ncbi:MAG: hypothetical protein IJD80_02220, partial [Oscillospiraceae bacterium]|nr:hypothetical protein [Oscillospiraceae bacterium]